MDDMTNTVPLILDAPPIRVEERVGRAVGVVTVDCHVRTPDGGLERYRAGEYVGHVPLSDEAHADDAGILGGDMTAAASFALHIERDPVVTAAVSNDRKRGAKAREAYRAEDPDLEARRAYDAECLEAARRFCARLDGGWARGKLELAKQVTRLKGNDTAKAKVRHGLALMKPDQSDRWKERADAGKRRKN